MMNQSELNTQQRTHNKSNLSLKGGYAFYFYDGEHEIFAHGSSWSGKETIFVDGIKVSSLRSIGRRSLHHFDIDGVNYEIEFNMVNIIKGELHCIFIKNGVHFKTEKLLAYKSTKLSYKYILIGFISGIVLGFAVAKAIKFWM